MKGLIYFISLVFFGSVNGGNVVKQISPKDLPFSSSSSENKHQGRIVNAVPAELNQFPYQVSVRSIAGSNASLCGGSVLSSHFVLTAAHCTKGYSRFEIGFGSTLLNSPQFKMTSFSKKEHPNFNSVLLNNDIALIKLPSPIPFGKSITPILLPKASQASSNWHKKQAVVSGFGRITDESAQVSSNLNFVNVRVIGNSDCASIFGSKIVTKSVICAKGMENVNQNACQGDSGGPLVTYLEDGTPVQIGIVSFVSSRGCTFGDPSGYTKVGKYIQWISKETGIPVRA